MKINFKAFIALITLLIVAGCAWFVTAPAPTSLQPTRTAAPEKTEITILAASSLTEPFSEIGKMFEAAHPGLTVNFNFASSSQLVQQIGGGAPADVFASASNKTMADGVKTGRVADGSAALFARNRLVVITPKDNPTGIQVLTDLGKSGTKLVLAAKEVPVGGYALQFLEKACKDPAFSADFQTLVLANVVSYEANVKVVLAKVLLGEADAGIVYTSDLSGENGSKVLRIDIPDALNVIAEYPIAVLSDSKQPELSKAFIEFVLSLEGQAVMAKFGFITVK